MKIIPTERDYRRWSKCAPTDGDLVFFRSPRELRPFAHWGAVFTSKELRANLHLWSLDHRSWYGYAANQASHALWLPTGLLDTANSSELRSLARYQVDLEVPTLLTRHHARSPKSLPKAGDARWITSKAWRELSRPDRAVAMKLWFRQNGIPIYDGLGVPELPPKALRELRARGLARRVNTYAGASGANCLATAASAVGGMTLNVWMHGGPFKHFLRSRGYGPTQTRSPRAGDVSVFTKAGQIVHAAYSLDEDFIFEKPGQDFYEPYRIGTFAELRGNWAGCRLKIWRARSPGER